MKGHNARCVRLTTPIHRCKFDVPRRIACETPYIEGDPRPDPQLANADTPKLVYDAHMGTCYTISYTKTCLRVRWSHKEGKNGPLEPLTRILPVSNQGFLTSLGLPVTPSRPGQESRVIAGPPH